MRYLLTITYDGKNYAGWQKQLNTKTIQGEIENALKILLKEDVNLVGSGRTDAGVSALGQVAHFDTDSKIENLNKFVYSLNGILPNDIKVLSIKETELHARFSAKKKTYLYKMYKSNIDLPLKHKSLRIDENVDIALMKECANLLVGEKDFKNFCASGSEVESTIRTVHSIEIVETKENIEFYITGNGFLYKMVRNIVGLLLEVGGGKISKEEFLEFAFGDKVVSKKTVPGFALCLFELEY